MKLLKILSFCLYFLCSSIAYAQKGTLLYVSLDNRPVCLAYAVETMRAAGWDILLPPAELLADANKSGDAEALFTWLEETAPQASAAVISSDALLYGGLVASRTHGLSQELVAERAERLVQLKENCGVSQVYVFTTIMRSPKNSAPPVEPDYYKEWGAKLFRLGALEDKLELKNIRHREVRELADLRLEIPDIVLDDYYKRRNANLAATELLLHGVESGDFDYLLIGRDDTAPYSQAHREARRLDVLVNELPKERIRFFAGADQLGLLLLTRAANKLRMDLPFVNVSYADGVGGETVPAYEDDVIAVSAKQHIFAAGALPVSGLKRADFVLALNTPVDGITRSAVDASNNGTVTPQTLAFIGKAENLLESGYRVILGDVKYGNGADKALVNNLFSAKIAYKLSAYAGWNTAGNSLGFALAQGLLSPLTPPELRKVLLQQRYLDDWAFQSNVRLYIYKNLIWPKHWPNGGLDQEQVMAAEEAVTEEMLKVAEPLLGADVGNYRFTLPWQRMFEIYAEESHE